MSGGGGGGDFIFRSSPFAVSLSLDFKENRHALFCWRPYRVECTGSLSTSEVKRHRARLVPGWGTAWEHLRVLPAFAPLPHTHTHPHPQQPVGQRFEGAKSAAPCPHRRTRINSTSRTLRLKLAHSAVNAARPSMGPSGTMPASTLLSVFGARESQAGTIRRAK